jgi:hypothetical protein
MTEFPPTLVFKSDADATVSTSAVVQRLLGRLDADRHELVLFDINRFAAKSVLTVYDPRALSTRVMRHCRTAVRHHAGDQRACGQHRGRRTAPGAAVR